MNAEVSGEPESRAGRDETGARALEIVTMQNLPINPGASGPDADRERAASFVRGLRAVLAAWSGVQSGTTAGDKEVWEGGVSKVLEMVKDGPSHRCLGVGWADGHRRRRLLNRIHRRHL